MRKFVSLVLSLAMLLSLGSFNSAFAQEQGSVYYLNFKPEQNDQWVALGKVYTEKTGVPVTVVTAASGTYDTTLKSELVKSDPPTLFQVGNRNGLDTWKDYLYDLKDTEVYKQLKSDEFAMKDGDAVLAVAYVIETYGIIYNKTLVAKYIALDGAKIKDVGEINTFATLKAVVEDIQARKDELGVLGAFTSAGMDSSSDWRFKTHLANLPIYYEFKDRGIFDADTMEGTYLDHYKAIWDLYINNSTVNPGLIGGKTGEDSVSEFVLGEAFFYQNGTWAYSDIVKGGIGADEIGMLPILIGAPGEENQGLTTGTENFWVVNKNAAEADVKATIDFLAWVISSDEGRKALAFEMGFVTPFATFTDEYVTDNSLIKAANEYLAAGKTPVSWNFSSIPSDAWKDGVGAALLQYAQGTKGWDAVVTAFVDGWATEKAAIK